MPELAASLKVAGLNPVLEGGQFFTGLDPRKGGKNIAVTDYAALCTLCVKWIGPTPFGYVVAWEGGRWKTSKTVDRLFLQIEQWRPRKIFIETNVGGDWLVDPIKRRGKELGFDYLPIQAENRSQAQGAKDTFIEQALEAPFAYHQIFIAKHLKGGEGEEQLFRWQPGGVGLDDLVDVLAFTWSYATQHRYGRVNIGNRKSPVVARTWRARYRSTRV